MAGRILYLASSHQIGLTGLLTEKACCLNRTSKLNFLYVAGEKEQFPGLVNRLEASQIAFRRIVGLDNHCNFLGLVKEFALQAKEFRPQAVHVQTNWQLAIAVAARYLYQLDYKIFYSIHGYRHNYTFRSLVAKVLIALGLYLTSDLVFASSSFLKRQFSLLDKKTHILFLGIDQSFFDVSPSFSFANAKRLMFAGEFRRGKNQDLLIHATKRYMEISGDRDLELYLPGTGPDLDKCQKLAADLGIQDKVFFPGFLNRDQILGLYLECQYALVPTNRETFGLSIAEPFVLGRVVFTRHVGVADDIITHGETGFLWDTAEDLVKLLVEVLPDKERCEKVARNAFANRDIFTWEVICKRYETIINDFWAQLTPDRPHDHYRLRNPFA